MIYSINPSKLLFIGRPVKEKGLGDLLNALILIKKINLELGIVGGEKDEIYNMYLQEVNLIKNHKINIYGKVPNEKLNPLINQYNIIVIPSHYENFGNVALEAMACGKAIIASRTGGLKEVVKDNITGLHFEPQNINDLANKIEFAFYNPQKILEFGINAHKEIKNYSWKIVTDKTEKLLLRLS